MDRKASSENTRYHVMNVFGVVTTVMLTLVNLGHLIWTVWLTAEQINTGWGYGTNMDIAALLPWITELVCVPALIVGIVYLVIACFFRHKRGILITNAVLFTCAVLQFGVTNLFIWC